MQITHYTKDKQTILQVLTNGFAYFPCKRKLIYDFVPEFKNQFLEPQQFGSISFTDLNYIIAKKFRDHFGRFGIGVSWDWAFKNDINRVIYMRENSSLFESCKVLFNKGIQDFKEKATRRGDPPTKMGYENKWMAATKGGLVYSNLLTLFEFMEPMDNAWQSEWRIVNKSPDYGFRPTDDIDRNRKMNLERIKEPKGWDSILKFIRISPDDITAFYCPIWQYFSFRYMLPKDYRIIPIITYYAKSLLILYDIKDDDLVKSLEIVMPDLIRYPERIEFTGFRLSPE
ncbi:MAG: hypothetical protein QME06_08925 [Desulfobacterales bacterium]|nr:hypothetical protein [Desulfobacterales bacterium]